MRSTFQNRLRNLCDFSGYCLHFSRILFFFFHTIAHKKFQIIFDLSVVDFLDVVRCEVGQEITMEYKEDEKANTVMSLTIDGVTQGKSEEEAKAADPTEVIPLEDEAKEVTE